MNAITMRGPNFAAMLFSLALVALLTSWLLLSDSWLPIMIGLIGIPVVIGSALSPAFFVGACTTAATNVFGFVDLDGGLGTDLPIDYIVMGVLIASTLFGGFLRGRWLARLGPYAKFTVFFFVLLGAILLLTTLRWGQSIAAGALASKPFVFYALAFFGAAHRLTPRQQTVCLRILLAAGIITAAQTIVACFIPLEGVMLGMTIRHAQSLSNFQFYRAFNPSYPFMFLAFFLAFFDRHALGSISRNVIIGVTALGTVLVGFRSFWAGVVVALFWVLSRRTTLVRFSGAGVRRVAIATILVVAAVLLLGAQDVVTTRISAIPQEYADSGASLGYRVEITRRLLSLFFERPLVGVGLLHAQGLGGSLASRVGLDSVFTVDVGWVDILMKTGLIGLLAFGFIFFRLMRSLLQDTANPPAATAATRAYIIMGVVALPGAAVFTWSGGIIPLALALGTLDCYRSGAAPGANSVAAASEGAAPRQSAS